MKPLTAPPLYITLFTIWLLALFLLSSTNHDSNFVRESDKFIHTAYFSGGAFCIFLIQSFRTRSTPRWLKITLITIVLTSAIGAIDEFHQSFVPGRSGNDLGDWLADTLGGITGSIAGAIFYFLPPIQRTIKEA